MTPMTHPHVMQALSEVLPAVRAEKVAAGGFWVLRPDSGDPVEAVLAALVAADKVFGEPPYPCLCFLLAAGISCP